MWIGVAWWKISIWLMGIAGVACLVGSFFIVDEGQAPLLLTRRSAGGRGDQLPDLPATKPILDTADEMRVRAGMPNTFSGSMQYAQQQMAQAGQAMAAMNQTLGTQGTVVNGVEGSAVIKSSQDTGQQQNLNPVYQLDLVVTVPGEQAYELTTHSEVNTLAVAKCVPGPRCP